MCATVTTPAASSGGGSKGMTQRSSRATTTTSLTARGVSAGRRTTSDPAGRWPSTGSPPAAPAAVVWPTRPRLCGARRPRRWSASPAGERGAIAFTSRERKILLRRRNAGSGTLPGRRILARMDGFACLRLGAVGFMSAQASSVRVLRRCLCVRCGGNKPAPAQHFLKISKPGQH